MCEKRRKIEQEKRNTEKKERMKHETEEKEKK